MRVQKPERWTAGMFWAGSPGARQPCWAIRPAMLMTAIPTRASAIMHSASVTPRWLFAELVDPSGRLECVMSATLCDADRRVDTPEVRFWAAETGKSATLASRLRVQDRRTGEFPPCWQARHRRPDVDQHEVDGARSPKAICPCDGQPPDRPQIHIIKPLSSGWRMSGWKGYTRSL